MMTNIFSSQQSPTLTRRSFLATTAALAASTSFVTQPASAKQQKSFDCVVIGAGLSGLSAARDLVAAGKSVKVIEALDRPGGRVVSRKTSYGTVIDGGAEFVGPTQNAILKLASDYSFSLQPTYNSGWNIYSHNGFHKYYLAAIGIPFDEAAGEVAVALAVINTIAKDFPVGRPWEHPNAAEWDSMTWQQFCDERSFSDSAKVQLALSASSTLSVEADEISALFMLNYIAAAGDKNAPGTMQRLVGVSEGAQEKFFAGGAAQLPIAMAAQLGDTIQYNAPVRQIVQTPHGIQVSSDQGTFNASKAIVAMSPAVMNTIDFQPGLPTLRTAVHHSYTMGSIGKFFAVYKEPFWRTRWLSGQVAGNGSPIDVTFESYDDDHSILMGFISADAMRERHNTPRAQIIEECLDNLVTYFGQEARDQLLETELYTWDDKEWSRGGPTGVVAPGALTTFKDNLTRPVGDIHWAGTETATFWTGYMDGAVTSGQRAAAEVIASL